MHFLGLEHDLPCFLQIFKDNLFKPDKQISKKTYCDFKVVSLSVFKESNQENKLEILFDLPSTVIDF
jgi:hypothetical protein